MTVHWRASENEARNVKEGNYPFKILSALAYNPLMCSPVTLDLIPVLATSTPGK
jgi:hypothetical protein